MYVAIFGEDHNDALFVKSLVEAIVPSPVVVKAMKAPLVLVNAQTALAKRTSNTRKIADVVKALSIKGNVLGVVVHRDCDDVEPNETALFNQIRRDFEGLGISMIVPAVPAWEAEAWMLLFPAAVAEYRTCWARLDLGTRRVGAIPNAKEYLRRAVRSSQKGCRDYKESDAPGIGRKIKELSFDLGQVCTKSSSFKRFHDRLQDIVIRPLVNEGSNSGP